MIPVGGKTRRETCPGATLSTRNLTSTGPRSNSGLCGERTAILKDEETNQPTKRLTTETGLPTFRGIAMPSFLETPGNSPWHSVSSQKTWNIRQRRCENPRTLHFLYCLQFVSVKERIVFKNKFCRNYCYTEINRKNCIREILGSRRCIKIAVLGDVTPCSSANM